MRILGWLTGIPLAVVIVVFALSNRQPASLGLWPFSNVLTFATYGVALIPLAAGAVAGWALAGAALLRARSRNRAQRRRIAELEHEIADVKREREDAAVVPEPTLHPGMPLPS